MGTTQSRRPRFIYDERCIETFPCKHYVTVDDREGMMNGVEIYNFCVNNNMPVPQHFMQYKDFPVAQQKCRQQRDD